MQNGNLCMCIYKGTNQVDADPLPHLWLNFYRVKHTTLLLPLRVASLAFVTGADVCLNVSGDAVPVVAAAHLM